MRLVFTTALLFCGVSAASLRACERRCGDEISLHCASDGVTYANGCFFQVAQCKDASLRVVAVGVCDAANEATRPGERCERACTREYMPVCGSNGVTYANKCMFRNAQQCEYNGRLRIVKYSAC